MECLLHETTDWNSPFLMFPKRKWRFPYACDASPLNAILTHTEMNGEAQNFGCDVALSPHLKNICKTLVTAGAARLDGLQPSLKNVRQKIPPNDQTRLKLGSINENFTTQSFSVLPTPFGLNVS